MAHKKSRDRVTFECLTQIDLKSYGELRAVPSVLSQADRASHLSWRCSAIATGRRLTVLVQYTVLVEKSGGCDLSERA